MILLIAVCCFNYSNAQYANTFSYLGQAIGRAINVASLYSDYEYAGIGCFYGALLQPGESITLNYSFDGDASYLISGVADEDVNDLDLYINDLNGNIILSDPKTDNVPIIYYTTSYTVNRVIKMKNFSAERASFCILQILKRGYRHNLSIQSLTEAATTCLISSAIFYDKGQENNISFTFPGSLFCLFGGCYYKGAYNGLMNVKVPYSGNYLLIGVGSNNISDVDIKIIRQYNSENSSGEVLCSDTKIEEFAFCDSYLYTWNNYYLELKNYNSDSKGFIFGVLLKEN